MLDFIKNENITNSSLLRAFKLIITEGFNSRYRISTIIRPWSDKYSFLKSW